MDQLMSKVFLIYFVGESDLLSLLLFEIALPTVHVNNTHADNSSLQPKPAVLGEPTTLKAKETLLLLVVLINEGEVLIEELRNGWLIK